MYEQEKQQQKLKRLIKELGVHKGRHTELVSVYVPAGYDLNKIINHLQQEQGTAENIKSTSTRKNVINALEKMIQHLKLYPRTPEHGLAAFSGNVAEREGQSDVRVWSVEPPIPLNTRIYRCDKDFVLEPLQEMLEVKDAYALLVLDRREADLALLKGKRIIPLVSDHSNVPGKYKTGGQSAKRFAMNRDLAAKEFYRKVAEHMKEKLFSMGKELKGIIVGGPGPTKYEWIDQGHLVTELRDKIIGVKDLSYTGEFGFHELLEKSEDILAFEAVAEEKKVMQKFFELLASKPGHVAYGLTEVEKDLDIGAVEILLLSETLTDEIIDRLSDKAEKSGTDARMVSEDTREGVQLKDMGGIAAILRYEVH